MANIHYIKLDLLVIIVIFCGQIINATRTPLQVIYAVNAGGDEHIDENGIRFQADPLRGTIGTESDYGKSLLMIGRVKQYDEILYQTERYHTASFGYDIKTAGDGEYVLVLKFCEVYFNEADKKVFDVILNGDHTVIADLDIFHQVGKGNALDEYIYFTISRGRLYYKEEESEIRGGKIRIDFIKGFKDNPKINAFVLLKGDVERVPKLPPLVNDNVPSKIDIDKPIQNFDTDRILESESQNDDINVKPAVKPRKTSGPKQPNPYSMDDSSVMLPVFIAIGAFIPLLFCLCKL